MRLTLLCFFSQANVRPPHSFQIPDGWGSDCIRRGPGDSRTPDRSNLQTGLSMETPGILTYTF